MVPPSTSQPEDNTFRPGLVAASPRPFSSRSDSATPPQNPHLLPTKRWNGEDPIPKPTGSEDVKVYTSKHTRQMLGFDVFDDPEEPGKNQVNLPPAGVLLSSW